MRSCARSSGVTSRRFVVNASPVIFLFQIQALPLLTGTLGIVLRAKQAGLVPAARPLVNELLRKGLYLSKDLVKLALEEIGE